MTVHVTFHENLTVETNQGKQVPALGPQIGNAGTLTVSGSKANFGPAPRDCMVHFKVVTACRMAIGALDAVHNANSEWLPAGYIDTRKIGEGERLSIVQSA